jgi:hypothetical protein
MMMYLYSESTSLGTDKIENGLQAVVISGGRLKQEDCLSPVV